LTIAPEGGSVYAELKPTEKTHTIKKTLPVGEYTKKKRGTSTGSKPV